MSDYKRRNLRREFGESTGQDASAQADTVPAQEKPQGKEIRVQGAKARAQPQAFSKLTESRFAPKKQAAMEPPQKEKNVERLSARAGAAVEPEKQTARTATAPPSSYLTGGSATVEPIPAAGLLPDRYITAKPTERKPIAPQSSPLRPYFTGGSGTVEPMQASGLIPGRTVRRITQTPRQIAARAAELQRREAELQARAELDFYGPGAGVKSGLGDPEALKVAEKRFRDVPGFALDNSVMGLRNLSNSAVNTANMVFSEWDIPEFAQDWMDDYRTGTREMQEEVERKNFERYGKQGVIAGQLHQSVVSALPHLVLAYFTGGTSAAASLAGKAPGLMGAFQNLMNNRMFYFSIAQTIGDAYQRAKESGASEAQARWAAIGESLLNAGIELGGGVDKFVKKQAPAAWDILRSGLEEGLEEVTQGMVSEAISSLVYDPEKPFFSMEDENAVINPNRMLQEFIGGAAGGTILSGGAALAGKAVNGMGEVYHRLKQRDGGKTADFDAQYRHYYELGRKGGEKSESTKYRTETPIDAFAAKEAVYEGRNTGTVEAAQTILNVIEGRTISNEALNQAMAFPETREMLEMFVKKLPGDSAKARRQIRMWQHMQAMDVMDEIHAERYRATHNVDPRAVLVNEAAQFARQVGEPSLATRNEKAISALANQLVRYDRSNYNSRVTGNDLMIQGLTIEGQGKSILQTFQSAMMELIRARVNPGDSSRRTAQVIHRVLTDNMDALKARMEQEAIRRGFAIRRMMPEAALIGGPPINHVRMDNRNDDWRVSYMKQDYNGGESLRQTNYEGNEIGSLLTHPESSLADWQQYEEYKTILGKDAPKTLAEFQEIKYNNDAEWSYIERLVRYLKQYPDSDKRYFDVWNTVVSYRIRKGIALPPKQKQAFILPNEGRDPYHIMHRMIDRQMTDDDIRSYMKNAKVMFAQWNGRRRLFVSEEGMCVIEEKNGEWKYITAWTKNDYDEDSEFIIEVIRNAGL